MKEFVAIAKRTISDRDGFFQGFIKGAAGTAITIILLTALASFN